MGKKRLKVVVLLLLIVAIMGQIGGCSLKQKNISEKRKENSEKVTKNKKKIKQTNIISEVLTVDDSDYQIKNSDDALEVLKKVTEKNKILRIEDSIGECQESHLLESTYYTFPQYYKGIPVYGRKITLETNSTGKVNGINGNFQEFSNINIKGKIGEEKALKIVKSKYENNVKVIKMGKTIFSLYNTDPILSWQFCVKGNGISESCLVDAYTGKIIFCNSDIDMDKESAKMNLENIPQIDGEYILSDQNRNINVYDAKKECIEVYFQDNTGNKYIPNGETGLWYNKNSNYVQAVRNTEGIWQLYDLKGNVICENAELKRNIKGSDKTIKVSSGNAINSSCMKAFNISCNIYDFCNEVLKRKGFDNKNGLTEVFVNEGHDSDNAFSYMGKRTEPTFLLLGYEENISAELIGHEYFHSVERTISGLSGKGESGALKEAFCDVMGEIVEDWDNDGILNDSCDWKHGERNMKNPADEEYHYCLYEIKGEKCPVEAKFGTHKASKKNITEPNSKICSVVYKYPKSERDENKFTYSDDDPLLIGRHVNSTIISHALYSMVHPKEGKGITMEELAKLLYTSMGSINYDDEFEDFATWLYYKAQTMNLSDEKLTSIKTALKDAGLSPQKVMVIKIEVPESVKKNTDVEISNYFSNYKQLKELLSMKSIEQWQFSESESYMVDEFYLEWLDEMFSMKNEGASYIKIYGVALGDKMDQANSELQGNGWEKLYDNNLEHAFITIIDDRVYYISFTTDENENIQSWYLNNWPEGEEIDEAVSRLKGENQDTNTSTLDMDRTYEYENGQFLSQLTISENNGVKNASLMFWHDNGRSSSDEEFYFEWNDESKEYDVVGTRSNQKFHLYFEPINEGVYIKVVCTSGSYFSWQTGQESAEWVSENYLYIN